MKFAAGLSFLLLALQGCVSADLRSETREQLNELRTDEITSELDKPAVPKVVPVLPSSQSASTPRVFGCDESKPPVQPRPLVKVAPIFPREAAARNIEGFVTVEFTVTKFGRTEDIVVVESSPAEIFDLAAVQAARRFKYAGKGEKGRCIKPTRLQNQIQFQLPE